MGNEKYSFCHNSVVVVLYCMTYDQFYYLKYRCWTFNGWTFRAIIWILHLYRAVFSLIKTTATPCGEIGETNQVGSTVQYIFSYIAPCRPTAILHCYPLNLHLQRSTAKCIYFLMRCGFLRVWLTSQHAESRVHIILWNLKLHNDVKTMCWDDIINFGVYTILPSTIHYSCKYLHQPNGTVTAKNFNII